MKTILSLACLLLMGLIIDAIPVQSDLIPAKAALSRQALQMMKVRQKPPATSSQNDEALIIGDDRPDETLTISHDYQLQNDLVIINQGVVEVIDADFTIDGDLHISGQGRFTMNNSTFRVEQEYIYENEIVVTEKGILRFANTEIRSNGQSVSLFLGNDAEYKITDSQIKDGFITVAMAQHATASMRNVKTAGEFLCFGENDVSFQNCDLFLFWFVLPKSSDLDVAFPRDLSADEWCFSDSLQNVEGIPYRLGIENCTDVMWGLISETGCEATFRDTEFRTVGLLFSEDDSLEINGLTNGSQHDDERIDLPDRDLHLINSKVETWNFYVSSQSRVTIQNCVFGEILTQQQGEATVLNSLCDGSGGYIGSFNESKLIIGHSMIKTQVIARDQSVLLGLFSSFTGMEINADEGAVMLIANTLHLADPRAYTKAVIFEAQMQPFYGTVDGMVPINGSMQLVAGPQNPVTLTGYRIEYTRDDEDQTWLATDGLHNHTVEDSVLAHWNTDGLAPGYYNLRLTFWHSYGDSVAIDSYARLDALTATAMQPASVPSDTDLLQNYPNPFNSTTAIDYSLAQPGYTRLVVYDLLGRRVKTLVDAQQQSGRHRVLWDGTDEQNRPLPAGIYYGRLQSNGLVGIIKLVMSN